MTNSTFASLKNLFRKKEVRTSSPPMKTFSEENLDKLADEYKLLSQAQNRLQQDRHYHTTWGRDNVTKAVNDIVIQRLIIEAKIDALTEFLKG